MKKLPGKIAEHMSALEECGMDDIIMGIGPHIKRCCFEVGTEVFDAFTGAFGKDACVKDGGRMFADMEFSIIRQMEEAGMPAENITVSDLCTYCNEDLFYSHRRDHGMTGAMAGMIQKL